MPEPAQDFRPAEAVAAGSVRPGLLDRDEVQLVGLTVIVKLAILNFGVFAVSVIAGHQLGPGLRGILEIWNWWDAPHYLDLAVLGYRAVDPGVQTIQIKPPCNHLAQPATPGD